MRLALICSKELKKDIEEMLESRSIILDSDSEIYLLEKGMSAPDYGIAILFDPAKLDKLAAFFDSLGQANSFQDNYLVVKSKDSYELIKYENIAFFQASGNYTYCQTPLKKYEVKQKLYELENSLWNRGFVRVNKSFIVNLLMVQEIIPWFGERLLLKLKEVKTEIEVSRSYVRIFKRAINM